MNIAHLPLAALTLTVAMATAVVGQPPDEIPNSLIPPLQAKPARTAGRVAPAARVADAASAKPTTPTSGVTTNGRVAPAVPATSTPGGAVQPYAKDSAAANDYDARLAIWNSPEMVDARRYVLEYSERSARSSLKEGEQFLARVSQLSPSEMTAWLERLQARRGAIARQQEVTSAARQFSLEQAAQRLEQARQAQANINQWQSLSAMYLQDRLQSQQLSTREQRSLREFSRSNAIASQRLLFDPFAPSFDPASPSRRTRAIAATVLPGDLPRGDPANFSEPGVNGESSAAQSGAAVVAPAPAPVPAAASAPPSGE